jgi:hypothetical protein
VSAGSVAVIIPARVAESGITSVFKPVFPLFDQDARVSMKESGMFALSEPPRLEEVIATAGLTVRDDDEIDCPIVFDDVAAAERAFMASGPTQLAIGTSGARTVAETIRSALEPFTDGRGRVLLPAAYRAVLASS